MNWIGTIVLILVLGLIFFGCAFWGSGGEKGCKKEKHCNDNNNNDCDNDGNGGGSGGHHNHTHRHRVFPVGVTPHGVAVTPCGTFAYVANNNNYSIAGSDSVTVINLKTNKVLTTIVDASFDEPYTVTINKAGSKAYITNSNGQTVTVVDIKTNTVDTVIAGFDGPSGLAIVPGTNIGYVNNYGSPAGVGSGNGNTVQRVDLKTNTLIGAPIVVDLAPAAIAASPDGKYVYTVNYTTGAPGTGTISVIQTNNNSVTTPAYTGLSGPFAIAISRNGKRAYITNFGSNNFSPYGTTVSVIDLTDMSLIKDVTLGIQPSGIDLYYSKHSGDDYAVVSNYNTLYAGPMFTNLTPGESTVQLINLSNNQVSPIVIPVGQSPSQVAVHGDRAFVTCYTANVLHTFSMSDYLQHH